jgi:hypothetical protein
VTTALPTITPRQCRDARKLLGWIGLELARKAEVEPVDLIRFEYGTATLDRDALSRIRSAIESAGIDFVYGVPRLKAPRMAPSR